MAVTRRHRHTIGGLLLLLMGILASPATSQTCYETCEGFGEWLYGRGWIVPPYSTQEIGTCLERPLDDGGQGSAVEEALREIYDAVVEADIRPGGGEDGDAQAHLVRGLNAALPGATAPNSEGLYYCVYDKDTNDDAFYWVQNCEVLSKDASGNAMLCEELTEEETEVGTIGYVVDDALTQQPGKVFVRYVFNETHALPTADQPLLPEPSDEPLDPADGFRCSSRPWYQQARPCQDPAKVLCPTYFQGTQGLGTFQTYGNRTRGAVAAQDIAGWLLCQCLLDMTCDGSNWEAAGGATLGISRAMLFGCFITISFWLGR
ncbi:hypothetical protein ACHAWF_001083 [Thalassiosira exigua]